MKKNISEIRFKDIPLTIFDFGKMETLELVEFQFKNFYEIFAVYK